MSCEFLVWNERHIEKVRQKLQYEPRRWKQRVISERASKASNKLFERKQCLYIDICFSSWKSDDASSQYKNDKSEQTGLLSIV